MSLYFASPENCSDSEEVEALWRVEEEEQYDDDFDTTDEMNYHGE